MANDFLEKLLITVAGVGSVILGLTAFNIDVIGFFPNYVNYIKWGFLAIGGWLLYTSYKK